MPCQINNLKNDRIYPYPVVVHHGVHALDPHRVDVAVQHHPLVRLPLVEALWGMDRMSSRHGVRVYVNIRICTTSPVGSDLPGLRSSWTCRA